MAVRVTAILLVIASAALCMQCATAAAQYTVGGSQGWEINTDLSTWASGKKFAPGDALVFKYGGSHSVVEVSKADYDSCQIANAIQSHTDGNTVVTLSSPGKRYFVCGTPGHCTAGMKLEIDTLAAASAAPRPSPPLNAAAPRASPPASKARSPVSSPSKVPVSSPPASVPSPHAPARAPSKVPVSSPRAPASAPNTLTGAPPSSSPTEAPASGPKQSSSPAPSAPSQNAANGLCGVRSLVVMTGAVAAVVAMVVL